MPSGRSRHTTYAVLLLALAFLSSCATSGFQAGGLRSSIPVAAPAALAEVHSIAVPPFYGDTSGWRELAQEALAAAAPRITLIPLPKVDAASSGLAKELREAGYTGRIEPLQKLGRRLQADAVVNGVVLGGDVPELVIQIISSRDGRVLFWQSAGFTMKEAADSPGRRELLSRMLGPVIELAGTKERKIQAAPAAAETHPAVEQRHEAEAPSRPSPPSKPDRRHRPEKKKGPAQPPADENVSPM